MSSTRSKLATVVLVIIVVVLAIWKWPRHEEASPRTSAPSHPSGAAASQQRTAGPSLALDEPKALNLSVDGIEKALADYKAVSIYPPWSRPLSEETADKLYWNRTIISDLPMDDRPGTDLIYRFGAERWTVPYDEAFVSWIEVLDHGKRVPLTVLEAEVMTTSGRAGKLTYHDDGLDGDAVAADLRYSNRFVPSKVPALTSTAQQVRISAIIEANGIKRPIMRDFAYAPRKVADIIGARERLADGNLVVTLDVQVREKGLYTFEANVKAPDGTPIVFGEKSYPLEPGKRSVDIVMFGRAFTESRIDGPYVVQDIRGMRRFIDTDEQNFYFTYASTLPTRPYKHTQFSGAEWDAPERHDSIANFERLIDESRAGMLGKGDSDGKAHPLPTVDPSMNVQVPNPPTKTIP